MPLFKHSDKQPICDKHLTIMALWDPKCTDPKELERVKKITFKGEILFPHADTDEWFCVDCLEDYNAEQIKQGKSPIALCFDTLLGDKTEREVYGLEEKIH